MKEFIKNLFAGEHKSIGVFLLLVGIFFVIYSLNQETIKWIIEVVYITIGKAQTVPAPPELSSDTKVGLSIFGVVISGLGLLFLSGFEKVRTDWVKFVFVLVLFPIYVSVQGNLVSQETLMFMVLLYSIYVIHDNARKIEATREKIVANVLDSTRNTLVGFPKIFERAVSMVDLAQKEITFVAFNMNFGEPHVGIPSVADIYIKLPSNKENRTFSQDVRKFYSRLVQKIPTLTKVQVLTVSEDKVSESFLDFLSIRTQYKDFYKKEIDDPYDGSKKSNKEVISKKINIANEDILNKIKNRGQILDNNGDVVLNTSAKFFVTDTLPIQLLITDKGDKSSVDHPRGCLVFLVGTAVLAGSVNGDEEQVELGFYTELPEVINIYENLADALFNQAKNNKNAKNFEKITRMKNSAQN